MMHARRLSLIAVGLCLWACSSARNKPVDDGFDRNALLDSIGTRVIRPIVADSATRTSELAQHVAAYATLLANQSDATAAKQAAQQAFREGVLAWQRAEPLQVGPAGQVSSMTLGQGLRDEIYSWPTANPCRVDQITLEQSYLSPGYFDSALVNVYGFDALEYLLFAPSPANACAPNLSINANGGWAALSHDEIAQRRAQYAHVVAQRLLADVQGLNAQWQPGGAYLSAFVNAGKSGSPFNTAQMAVNELYAALFYIELEVKDRKLALPLGVSPDCAAATCPDKLEHVYAGLAREALVANLQTFRAVLVGTLEQETPPVAVGFIDFLAARGGQDLAEAMLTKTDAALGAMNNIDGDFSLLVQSNHDSAAAIYRAVKALTDDLKTQFVSVLDLRVPSEGAGDND